MSLTDKEIGKIIEYLDLVLASMGISIPKPVSIVYVDETGELELIKKGFIKVEEGVLIYLPGIIAVRKEYLANMAIRKLATGALALAFSSTYGSFDINLIDRIIDEHFNKMLSYLYAR
ncbi:MAG: hypothetical protein DRJ47_11115 [Thermoprotei archaeon]|nr:MAG: hypothetical protein DRJ47_11115 [Thermoprotei archaeon]